MIRPLSRDDIESLCDAANGVCRERWFFTSVDGFTLEQTREFHGYGIDLGWPQVVAVLGGRVVGWCAIRPGEKTGFTHVGHLGIGVRREYRRQGLGRRLITDCLARARQFGLEKVELGVYTDNNNAIRLYQSAGFEVEGCRKKARKLEGRYQDIQLMALHLQENG